MDSMHRFSPVFSDIYYYVYDPPRTFPRHTRESSPLKYFSRKIEREGRKIIRKNASEEFSNILSIEMAVEWKKWFVPLTSRACCANTLRCTRFDARFTTASLTNKVARVTLTSSINFVERRMCI